MIFGTIDKEETYCFLHKAVRECFAYVASRKPEDFIAGSHPIDGDRFFVNVAQYTTTSPENRFWEAHRQYLDVHMVLEGKEQIDLNLIGNMKQGEYAAADDFLSLEGDAESHILLRPGYFLVCAPCDAHRTAVAVDGPEEIKKLIFKVKIDG